MNGILGHLVTIVVGLPVAGAILLALWPRRFGRALYPAALAVSGLTVLASFLLIPGVASRLGSAVPPEAAGFSFVERYAWIPSLGIRYFVGVDGISLFLVVLTTAITPLAILASTRSIRDRVKEYLVSFLLLEAGMLGAFVALDLFLFYVFWELMLVPMYLIIGIWGGPRRVYAAVKFFLYTMAGSVLMLVAILYLVSRYSALAGHPSFDLIELRRLVLPAGTQMWLFLAFAFAFAIKVPMWPLHTWLPDAHVEAPTAGSVVLAAVLLKLGAYGFLRYAMPLFPLAAHTAGPYLALLAIVGILFGSLVAWVQNDVKKLVAYSSVAHLGFVMLGIVSRNDRAVAGAILQMVNHGLSTGALFLLVGIIYERRHTREISEFGGLAKVMPRYATLFVIVTLSSIGLPGLNGFVGEFLILAGLFQTKWLLFAHLLTALAATGVILGAVYMLDLVQKMFHGAVTRPANEKLADVSGRELATLAPIVLCIVLIGVAPSPFLRRIDPAVDNLLVKYEAKFLETQRDDRERLLSVPADEVIAPDPAAAQGQAMRVEVR